MSEITDPGVREFLQEGTRTGKVAFTATNGRPLVAPVWFIVDADEIVFTTGEHTAKAASIARDHRLSVCVDLEEAPYAFVQVQGEARTSNDLEELLRVATAIAKRYVGPERAAEFGRRNATPGELVVRLRPRKVVAVFDVIA